MKKMVAFTLVSLACLAITFACMEFVFYYSLAHLTNGVWTHFHKYLLFNFNFIDLRLAQFFPLLFVFLLLIRKRFDAKEMIFLTFTGLLSMVVSGLFGVLVGIYTWQNGLISPFLPKYIVYQPFAFYWTIFIVAGLLVPLGFFMVKNRKSKFSDVSNEMKTNH